MNIYDNIKKMVRGKTHCDKCQGELNFIDMKRLGKTKYCPQCYSLLKKTYVKFEENPKQKEPIVPKIKKTEKKKGTRYNKKGLYLTKDEKNLLYRQAVSQGMNSFDASDRVNHLVKYLDNLVNEMRNKNKSQDQINKKFKEEYYKLCQSNSIN